MFIRSKYEEHLTEVRNGFQYDRTHNPPLNTHYIVSLAVADSSLDDDDYPYRIEFILNNNKTAMWMYPTREDREKEYNWVIGQFKWSQLKDL